MIALCMVWCGQIKAQATEEHDWSRFLANTTASVAFSYGFKTILKETISEERPDHSDNQSFPSGHTAMAFAGATSLHKEFGKTHPWVSVVGFGAATMIGVERVVSNRHHWYDVVAGAGLGFAVAEATWWLSDQLFPRQKNNIAVGFSGNALNVVVMM